MPLAMLQNKQQQHKRFQVYLPLYGSLAAHKGLVQWGLKLTEEAETEGKKIRAIHLSQE